MKIWFPVIRGGSGTDVFTRRLAVALKHRGVTTEITWVSPYYQLVPFLLRRVAPPSGTQVIHANSWNGFAFKRKGIPLVVTEHLNILDPLYRPYKSLAQRIYHESLIRRFTLASFRLAAAITAVSHFTALSLGRVLGIQPVHVIYNWVDVRAFSPPKQNSNRNKRPFRLLFVGNLSRRKGADLLVPIMRKLGTDFELHFTSGLKWSRTMRAEKNMTALGRIMEESEIVKAYQWCDALLFPSRLEGFGLAALEAMACGKPVIATNTSSLPEVVENGVSGILCPPDDIGAFAVACGKLADSDETGVRYGQAGRRRAVELFSEDHIIPQYIKLYEKLLRA